MEKEFVPYDRALKLKEIGFDIESDNLYFHSWGNVSESNKKYCTIGKLYNIWKDVDETGCFYPHVLSCPNSGRIQDHFILAPTFSQAFRWFREKHGLVFNLVGSGPYYPSIALTYMDGDSDIELYEFDTYEEAELACLDKLIEILENKID